MKGLDSKRVECTNREEEAAQNNVVLCTASTLPYLALCFSSLEDGKMWGNTAMLDKLHQCGFRGPFLSPLKNYIRNRQQNVVLGNLTSSLQVLRSGVPQKSILAPLLFNLCICL